MIWQILLILFLVGEVIFLIWILNRWHRKDMEEYHRQQEAYDGNYFGGGLW